MLIRGEALVDTVTIAFTISGPRNDWNVTITTSGGITGTDATIERTWFPLFTEMLAAAFESANRHRFPGRKIASEARR